MRHLEKKQRNKNCHERLKSISDIKYVVDRLHIKGHSQKWCTERCHPDLFPELENVNTVVCEQINFWLGKFKHIMKHMNIYRFNFFLFIILNEYNLIKLNGRLNINHGHFIKTITKKRKFDEIVSDDE